MRKHLISSTLLALMAAAAHAQVKPVEPFGGRPFGAPPEEGTAQPQGTTMGAPGMSSVQPPGTPNPGTPPVVVAPVPVPAPPPPPPAAPPAQVPPAQAPAMQPPQPAPAAAAPGAPVPAPAPATPLPPPTPTPPPPSPSSLAPPFSGNTANRNAPPAAAAAATGATQQPVRGLPADAPKLVISGSVFSPDRAKRVLIVNGQVAHEGADLGQGVVLEEVRHEGAVLGYKGSRYNVTF